MNEPAAVLHPKNEFRILSGHNWIFSNEISRLEPKGILPEPGAVIQVKSARGVLLGSGFYHPNALIAVRMMTRGEVPFSPALISERIVKAAARREKLLPGITLRRLVFSDSDDLSGLIIDQFGQAASVQIHSAGMEKYLSYIEKGLRAAGIQAAWLRNDTSLRQLEGLSAEGKPELYNDAGKHIFEVTENGLIYEIDPAEGQKTGFYIDQRENRAAFAGLIKPGDRVMDAFCNEGGFALMAARAGAKVMAVDISKPALERASKNAERNGLAGRIEWRAEDVVKWLPTLPESELFDLINLDPPNFAHNRKSVPVAMHAYMKLHEAAIKRLKPGGILATSSCSHHVNEEKFFESVEKAMFRTGSRLNLVYRGAQPADHPVRVGMPETAYLKCFFFEKIA